MKSAARHVRMGLSLHVPKEMRRPMKKLIAALLISAALVSAAYADSAPAVKTSPWAQNIVGEAYSEGLMSPDFDLGGDYTRRITRLELARLTADFTAAEKGETTAELASECGLSLPEGWEAAGALTDGSAFSDTDSAYAALAARLGIAAGSGGLFRPDAPVTRAQAAAMLHRCMVFLGVTEADSMPLCFSDGWALPDWAREDIKFISGRTDGNGGAVMGGSGGSFVPGGGFTVEQAVAALVRMHASLPLTAVCDNWRSAPGYDIRSVVMTFGGDCTFGRDRDMGYSGSFDEMYDRKGENYFFSGIPEFFSDDLTMVNFEGTLTDAVKPAVKQFVFKGRAAYARVLTAGSIDVVTVANNHSMDYLQKGYGDTLKNLAPYVTVTGYGNLPVVDVNGVRIGFAANTGWSFDAAQRAFIDNAVKTLRANGADIVIFSYHWGVERSYHSNETQRAIAHYCIDKGADLVIGQHPHVVQETETYRGRQIVYSLGNLVFGGNFNPSEKNCLIYRQSFYVDLSSRLPVHETHAAVHYRVSSVNYRNDYHPVRVG
jgi:hypothetical protein